MSDARPIFLSTTEVPYISLYIFYQVSANSSDFSQKNSVDARQNKKSKNVEGDRNVTLIVYGALHGNGHVTYILIHVWRERRMKWITLMSQFTSRSPCSSSLCLHTSQPQWRSQEFCSGGGFNKFSWGQTERGSGGGSPLVRGFWRQL